MEVLISTIQDSKMLILLTYGLFALAGILSYVAKRFPKPGGSGLMKAIVITKNVAFILLSIVIAGLLLAPDHDAEGEFLGEQANLNVVQRYDLLKEEIAGGSIASPSPFTVPPSELFNIAATLLPEAKTPYDSGLVQVGLGQFEKAVESFTTALDAMSSDDPLLEAEVMLFAGIAATLNRDYHDAIRLFTSSLDLRPDYAEAWFHMGLALANVGNFPEAFECYDQARRFMSDWDCVPLYLIGAAYLELGRNYEAVRYFDTAKICRSGYVEAWFGLGMAFNELGQIQGAISSLDSARMYGMDSALSYLWQAVILAEVDTAASRVAIDAAQNYESKVIAAAKYGLGLALNRSASWAEARASLDSALLLNWRNPDALRELGVALYHLKQRDSALSCIDAAFQMEGQSVLAYINKGEVLVQLGLLEEASVTFQHALANIANRPELGYKVARGCFDAGNNDCAVIGLDLALKYNPGWPEALELKAELVALTP